MKNPIKDALTRLRQHPSSNGAFVIFEDRRTGDFVQFIGGQGKPLVLDLPTMNFDAEKMQRAEAFFAQFGVSHRPGDFSAFNVNFGDDVEGAATVALLVFSVVHGRDEIDLEIEESG